MPQIKSRKKDLRQATKRRERNVQMRRTAKQALRAAREQGSAEAPEIAAAYKALDKAAKRGALHHRTVARRKSRLMKKLQSE
jgi:small subunit ribosomal protein S20